MAPVAVVKIGTSSIADEAGELVDNALWKLANDLATARAGGHELVLVMSGAIAAGMPALGLRSRPTDIGTLQAIAAVGQPRLQERMNSLLGALGIVAGQVLLTPYDFAHRNQYLHARETLHRLRELGVLPIVNENDTVADDEIRYGDNDRLAALVAHLVRADTLLLLTDTGGMFTADPRHDAGASLIEEIVEVDEAMEQAAGGAGTERGSGGMASKLAAAKIAAWSGVRAVIASASAPDVIAEALAGRARSARRSRRGRHACRRASSGSRSRRVPTAASGSTPARARRWSTAGSRCSPRGYARSKARSRSTRRSRSSVTTGGCSRRVSAATARRSCGPSRGNARPTCPSGSPQEVVHRDDLVVLP